MAENQLLFGLKRRYAQTLGAIRKGEDRAGDLAHLAAVILMFSPVEDLAAIRPVRPYRARTRGWSRTAIRLLRAANRPLRGRELARLVMQAHGVDPADMRTLVSIECGMQPILLRLADSGVVEATGKPRRWSVVREGGAGMVDGYKGWRLKQQ